MNDTRKYSITSGSPEAKVSVTPYFSGDGIDLCRIHVEFPEAAVPSPVTVRWEEDMVNILSVWNPTGGRHRAIHQWFGPTRNFSNFCSGAPILCTVGDKGFNTLLKSGHDPVLRKRP